YFGIVSWNYIIVISDLYIFLIIIFLKGTQGEQFNNQKSIWLGYSPATGNTTIPFHGVLSGVFYNGLLLCDLASGLSQREDVHITRHSGPEVNSYHDEDASTNKIGNLNPSIPLSPKTSTISMETESQFIKEWIQFPPREHASETDPGETSSQLQGHVNIWLFICFGAAGLVLVASLLFFAFHCFQRHHQRQEHSTDQYQAMDHRFGEYEISTAGNIRPIQVNETANINTFDHLSASYSTNFQV
ncbi:unnamed protein product, partial [Hymenolepis diminuta]|uniref:LAM_G_DOMAIN domain-containing protein n=1 Tax=Hymenolepis diminuta TaxID=6216 RepID=A0A0R3SZ17_HYMDI